MTFATYTIGVPNPPNNPSADVNNMQTNTTSISNLIEQDHIGFNLTNGGFHNVIHQSEFSTGPDPVPVLTFGELYVKKIAVNGNTDDVLFFQTGSGRVSQLTGLPTGPGLQGSVGTNGWTFLPNGLIMQWGVVFGTHGGDNHFNSNDTGTVTFATANLAFPQNCFGVWTQPIYTNGNAPATGNTATFAINNNVSKTSFTWFLLTNSASYTSFYWWALGN